MLELFWSRLPSYIRWPIVLGGIFLILPVRIYEGARGLIQYEVHAVINPLEEKRELQMNQMKEDISQIKQDTRDIKNYLMQRR